MARAKAKPPSELRHHWYLAEWARYGKKTQADAQRQLGWSRAKASYLFTGRQQYSQENLDEAAIWLSVRPYELLMPVDLAMHFRSMGEAARVIVDNTRADTTFSDAQPIPIRAKTG